LTFYSHTSLNLIDELDKIFMVRVDNIISNTQLLTPYETHNIIPFVPCLPGVPKTSPQDTNILRAGLSVTD
jgi:hypothetical protein